MRFGWLGVLLAAGVLAWTSPATAKPEATITGSFGDSCRDFAAHSSKDISHVEIQYVGGGVSKDDTVASPDFSVDGGAGEEIDFVLVKSGTTRERFDCSAATNDPPVAVLELQVPSGCAQTVPEDDFWHCGDANAPREAWLSASGVGFSCFGNLSLCDLGVDFRGTSSSDTENDIASWKFEFDDGTVVEGAWGSDPAEAASQIQLSGGSRQVTFTVTDSAGQSSSDTMVVSYSFPD